MCNWDLYCSFTKIKKIQLISLIILISTGLLTYSRMFFVFLGIFILIWSYVNRTVFPLIISSLIFPIALSYNPVIYYRFLNTIDSLFGSNYSYGLTESSSDRVALLSDSFSWLTLNPMGGNIELMERIAPGASGEHLLFIFLANINGLLFGLIFFLIALYVFL